MGNWEDKIIIGTIAAIIIGWIVLTVMGVI